MFSSLRGRLWLSYALMIAAALTVVAIVLFFYLYRNPLLYRQTLERLQAVETVLAAREDASTELIPASLERAASAFKVRIVRYAEDQQVVSDSGAAAGHAILFPRRGILSRKSRMLRDEGGQTWLYTMRRLPDGSWLLVASPRPRLSILNVFADELMPLFLQAGCMALLLSLLAAYRFARWVADPLQTVVAAARASPAQEVLASDRSGPREVQDLTHAFNAMLTRVHASQRAQRALIADVSHELRTPLTSIQGFAQAILDDTASTTQDRKHAAQVIQEEAGRMHRLVMREPGA